MCWFLCAHKENDQAGLKTEGLLSVMVIHAIIETEQKITRPLRFSILLSLFYSLIFYFPVFSVKNPDSNVAQMHQKKGETGKNSLREESNLIQLKATISWLSHSALWFGFFPC